MTSALRLLLAVQASLLLSGAVDHRNIGKSTNTGAHADLWCGPGMAKIALKHYFSDPSTQKEVYTGGMPSFEAVDGSGIAVMSDVTYMIRNNELGGMLAPGTTPLAPSSASFENFSPTGAEGAPNAAMVVPYQADYYFLSTDTAPANTLPTMPLVEVLEAQQQQQLPAVNDCHSSSDGHGVCILKRLDLRYTSSRMHIKCVYREMKGLSLNRPISAFQQSILQCTWGPTCSLQVYDKYQLEAGAAAS
ncbi:TPA: hypothetical protein ACH3X1_007886 [Trebouxia sp. C0004]